MKKDEECVSLGDRKAEAFMLQVERKMEQRHFKSLFRLPIYLQLDLLSVVTKCKRHCAEILGLSIRIYGTNKVYFSSYRIDSSRFSWKLP